MHEKGLINGIDYYINEAGLMVFTEKSLLQRGYCCENRCKHCPYGFNENGTASSIEKSDEDASQ